MTGGWPLGDKVQADAIFGALFKESDRSAAIVACVILEESLEKKLKEELRTSSLFEKLFGPGRPLHFFGSRNQLAYLIGLYDKPFFQELDTIGEIRNAFAHNYADRKTRESIKSFKSPAITALCDKLKLLEQLEADKAKRSAKLGLSTGRNPSWYKDPLDVLKKHHRIKYLNTCGLCVSALSGLLDPKTAKKIGLNEEWGKHGPLVTHARS